MNGITIFNVKWTVSQTNSNNLYWVSIVFANIYCMYNMENWKLKKTIILKANHTIWYNLHIYSTTNINIVLDFHK